LGVAIVEYGYLGCDPQHDKDASVKFILDVLLLGKRFIGDSVSIAQLIYEKNEFFHGIGGDPGWSLSRKQPPNAMEGRFDPDIVWPEGATFRAYVDPDDYELKYPEMFLTKAEFYDYLQKGIDAFLERHPDKLHLVEPLINLMKEQTGQKVDKPYRELFPVFVCPYCQREWRYWHGFDKPATIYIINAETGKWKTQTQDEKFTYKEGSDEECPLCLWLANGAENEAPEFIPNPQDKNPDQAQEAYTQFVELVKRARVAGGKSSG
jgi:hypothetical protein